MQNRLIPFILILGIGFGLLPHTVLADDRNFRLSAPAGLVDTGFLTYLLPRFSLKTGVRIEVVAPEDEGDAGLARDGHGTPAFAQDGAIWWLLVDNDSHTGVERFVAWIGSDIGRRTITGFKRDGAPSFTPPPEDQAVAEEVAFEGDVAQGLRLSTTHCGRCHVVSDASRMNAIGSTPSFFVLRTMADWDERFQSFFVRKPHPSFTQIEDVTEPFAANRPPPIFPLEITLDDLDAILAYVSGLEPADLGAPIEHQ